MIVCSHQIFCEVGTSRNFFGSGVSQANQYQPFGEAPVCFFSQISAVAGHWECARGAARRDWKSCTALLSSGGAVLVGKRLSHQPVVTTAVLFQGSSVTDCGLLLSL